MNWFQTASAGQSIFFASYSIDEKRIYLLKRVTFLVFPFLVLFSITLQNISYLVQYNLESPHYVLSDCADEKNAEGKETKKLENEKDDKFVSSILMSISAQHLLDLEYKFHFFPSDHIIDVISPPPEMA